ncbi:MAG TPA: hypothetical protein VNH44_18560 [Micropepsaceae bacterium]|nr:hypothetical protein [Micropepsaceae bacterium]
MRAQETRKGLWLWRARRGSVAVHIGLMMIAIIGMAALGSEIVFLLYKHRQMQMVADAAALSASTALSDGYPSDLNVEARAIAAEDGFIHSVDGATVTVNNPPLTGSNAGNNQAVEVIVDQPQTLYMTSLFRSGIFDVAARAVAKAGTGSGCVLQLVASRNPGVTVSNGAVVTLAQCSLAVDSTGSTSLSMSGAAVINADSVSTSGGTSVTNGASINATNGVKAYQPPVADPYAGVAMPAFSGCGAGFTNNKSYGHGTWTLSPSNGVYCKGLAFTNDAIVTMQPGVYFVDRGTLSVGGSVKLTGTGVTIVLTSSTGAGYATASIGNGAIVTLSAPSSGATAGIIFFGDRRAPITNLIDFGGGALINITGALYFPSQKVSFSNGITNPSGCTQLIAGEIQFVGGSRFQSNCPFGVVPIGASNSTLVE